MTLDGALRRVALDHYGFPRTIAHPDWWAERTADGAGTDFWRLARDGGHRFWWWVARAYAPGRWSPDGQRVVLYGDPRSLPSATVHTLVIADPRQRTRRDLPVPADWDVQDVAWIDAHRLAVIYARRPPGASAQTEDLPGLALVDADTPRAPSALSLDRLTPGRRETTDRRAADPAALPNAWLAWSPAAHRLAIKIGSQGWIADLARGRSTPIPGALGFDGLLSWSPDGRRLLRSSRLTSSVWMVDVPSLRQQRVAVFVRNFVWIPGGHDLVADTFDMRRRHHRLALIGGDGRERRPVRVKWPAGMGDFSLISDYGDADQGILARAADC